jgi:hypothetical protein
LAGAGLILIIAPNSANSLAGDCVNVGAGDTEVGQIAVCQTVEFGDGVPVLAPVLIRLHNVHFASPSENLPVFPLCLTDDENIVQSAFNEQHGYCSAAVQMTHVCLASYANSIPEIKRNARR